MTKHTAAQLAALLAAVGIGCSLATTLADADLHPLVVVACTAAVFSAVLSLALDLVARLATRTFRCPRCAFTVRAQHTDAGESRRWQEIAADHPRHLGDSRA
ncbi:hypothetical protein Sdia_24010 [Streptomyces diastaticus subsp. diastaticus]|uniref:Lipoprotein n=1 Tax=Streptomyces diastaticus subsp. diastaticus TaxID=68040 RepID=A0ABQ1CMX7_STRDI|nr:hypothetical protein [Streptomyces diastaticus]GFH71633.1 hypothetical protein Sdia_24010 [Streptomyces diastaticus subsp. diastaticus]GGU13663.1 hypothetical protein GCM10015534_15560 [Streptomyces diastaticus subsp. diastaticus]